jgi:hypothetical protein
MRLSIGAILAGAALTSLAACNKPAPGAGSTSEPMAGATPLSMAQMPQRKAGLWRQTLHLAGSSQTMPPIQACTDAASEAKLTLLGQHKSRDLCQNQQFSRNPDGSIGFAVSCDLGPRGHTVSTGTISGDFGAHYQIAMDSRTTGAPLPQLNTERKMIIDAAWIGPCAAGQRGGDMITADGHTVNLTDTRPGKRYP